jgi:hypothetical protein
MFSAFFLGIDCEERLDKLGGDFFGAWYKDDGQGRDGVAASTEDFAPPLEHASS